MPGLRTMALAASLALLIAGAATGQNTPSEHQASSSSQGAATPAVTTLMQAAQRLRDATHDLVREPDAAKRNQIISQIDKTLLEVQSAIVSLPSNLLLAGARESQSKKAADEMAKAADKLNIAASKLNNISSGETHQSIQDIEKALSEIQQERTQIAASGAGPQTAEH
jgi:hypothetical protein